MEQSPVDQAQIQHIMLAMIPFIGLFALLIVAVIIVPLWVAYRKAGLTPALSLLVLIPGVGTLIALYVLAFARWKVVPAPPEYGAYPPPGYVPPAGYAPPAGYVAPGGTVPTTGYTPPNAPPGI